MAAGIDCIVVPSKEFNGKAISASTVRQCLQIGDWVPWKPCCRRPALPISAARRQPPFWNASAKRGMWCTTKTGEHQPRKNKKRCKNGSAFV
jgi:hypothetical protein